MRKKDYSEYKNIFYDEKIAYFIIETFDYSIEKNQYFWSIKWKNHFVSNPILKEYKFSIIKNAYTTFQEISMFLWNLYNPDDNIIKPDDKYIAYSKWFSCHSFRKRPTKKDKKKCSKKISLE